MLRRLPSRTWFLLVTAPFMMMGCRIKANFFKNSVFSKDAQSIVYLDTVIFERSPDGLSGNLSFKTKVDLFCELEFWAVGNENSPVKKNCQNQAPTKHIVESLTPLQADQKYKIRVYLWLPGALDGIKKSFVVEEDGDQTNISVDRLLVNRTIVPQQISETHLHALKSTTNLGDIRKSLASELGCTSTPPQTTESFSTSSKLTSLKALATSGYGTSSAKAHPNYPDRLIQQYDDVQRTQGWEWSAQWDNTQFDFNTLGPAHLNKIALILSNNNEVRLKDKDLNNAESEITIPQGAQISSVKWEVENPRVNSFLTVEFLNDKRQVLSSCTFAGSANQGQVADVSLDNVTHLLAKLDSYEFYIHDPKSIPVWLFGYYDWRQTKVRVL
ncbi:MAG: hypothetical protein AB7T49_02680 [Oligoflexales bacterium]